MKRLRDRLRIVGTGASSGSGVPALPTVDTTNLVMRWQPDHSTVTKSGSEVTAASNLIAPGTSDLAPQAAGRGMIEGTDNQVGSPTYGRKYWRFDAAQAMLWTGTSISTTNMAVFVVARALRSSRGWTIFSIGASGAGNTNGGLLRVSVTGNLAPWLINGSVTASSVAGASKHIMGCQPQVIGLSSGSGAGQGRMYMNSDALVVAGPFSATFSGGALGIYAHSPGAVNTWAEMDIFDVLVYNVRPSSAVADSIAAALQAGYGIPDITDSLVLDGDSITQGFPGDANPAYQQTAASCPTGGGWLEIPSGYRVLNVALSGNTTASLYARLTATNGPHSTAAMIGGALSGHNRIAFQIGINDLIGSARTPANVYNEASVTNSICNLIGEATNGYRFKYDKIYSCVNIATANATEQLDVDGLRILLRDTTQFRTDTGTTSTNLNIIDLPEITMGSLGGLKYFNTAALAGAGSTTVMPATAIFQNDGLHPTGTANIPHPGAEYMVRGGAFDGGSGDGLNSAFL